MARMKNFFPDQSKFKVNVFFEKVVPVDVEANLVGRGYSIKSDPFFYLG